MNTKRFAENVWKHYKAHGRNTLPWRRTRNTYRILVSEIMLQQTQVDRVIPKYRSFIKKFPSFKALAQAPLREVLLEWKGLGYNRRGLNLKRLAEVVTNEYRGKLPNNRELLMKLPGIGPYTAGAVMTFAWNKPETFIETNIRTVYIHHYPPSPSPPAGRTGLRSDKLPQDKIPDSYLLQLVEKTLDTKNPREWYYALMDYGSHLKKTVGNASRRSSGYTRQSKFEGSKRQLRARVLHEISNTPSISLSKLSKNLSLPQEKISPIIDELSDDGFISKNKNRISIAD